jgi:hypothetical protein
MFAFVASDNGDLEANQRHEWSVWFRSTTMPLREALRPLIEKIAIWQIDSKGAGRKTNA